MGTKLDQQRVLEIQQRLDNLSVTSKFGVAYPEFDRILTNFSRSPIFGLRKRSGSESGFPIDGFID